MKNSKRTFDKKVLIFGANGFLGSVITKKLFDSGYEVLPVIRPKANKSRLQDLTGIEILEVETSKWPDIAREYLPNVVICAQWNGVSKQDRENLEIQIPNLEQILNIALVVKESRVENFLCFGSQAEVKESIETIYEKFYDSSNSAYGNIKAKLHERLALLFEGSDTRFIWARIFSVYGPLDFSDSLLKQLSESQVSGKKLVINNPSKFWSFLYQDDFASAIELILKSDNVNGTLNIGNPKFHQIREIVAMWHGHSLTDLVDIDQNTNKIGWFPDVSKLEDLGWKPSVSLNEGIKRTQETWRKSFNSE